MTPREELHKLVWSQPMRIPAKARGISDVALAKQCKLANVPVPPRGWWARKEAGKPVKVEPLPPPPFVLRNFFPAIEVPAILPTEGIEEASEADPQPRPPTFRDLATVRGEIEVAVKPVTVTPSLADPHPIVARLLRQDETRKAEYPPGRSMSDYYGPKFVTPIQQRRLRILSAIFKEFERLGSKVSGSTHAGENFTISIGGHWTHILLGIEGGRSSTSFYIDGRRYSRPESERLRFDVTDHYAYRQQPKLTWQESEKPLEKLATEIIRRILLQVEDDARSAALSSFNWRIEDRARRQREAKLAREKAEADRIAREKAAAEARIKGLINGADMLERAARIRRYVEAIKVANASAPKPVASDALEAWAAWALTQADSIDPVISGRFLGDLDLDG
jgi:hypothetical protein